MSVEENKSIVLAYLEEISKGDYDKGLNLLADDATLWVAGNLPVSGTYTREKMSELMNGIASFFPNGLKITVDHLIGEGDYVAAEGHSHAEIAKGKIYQNKYHWLFQVKEGKIRTVREYADTLHAKEVLYG